MVTELTEDQRLLDKIRNPASREEGFSALVRCYHKRIYWLVRRLVVDHDDANDITQDIFIKVHQHLDGFREDSRLFTWIYRIATNESLGFLRRKRRRFLVPLGDVENELAGLIESGQGLSGTELEKRLQLAILELPEKQRLVFNLRYFDDMPYEQMAEVTGTSEGALKASYHHAVRKIERKLITALHTD